jgi:hypothetical protein
MDCGILGCNSMLSCRLLPKFGGMRLSSLHFTIQMKAIRSSKTLVTRHYNSEDHSRQRAVDLKMTVLWFVASCSLAEID